MTIPLPTAADLALDLSFAWEYVTLLPPRTLSPTEAGLAKVARTAVSRAAAAEAGEARLLAALTALNSYLDFSQVWDRCETTVEFDDVGPFNAALSEAYDVGPFNAALSEAYAAIAAARQRRAAP